MAHQFEMRLVDEAQDIVAAAGKEVIDAKNLMAVFDQAAA